MPRLTDRQIAEVLDLVRSGKSYGQVAKELGKSRSAIAGICHRHGTPSGRTARPKSSKHFVTPEVDEPGKITFIGRKTNQCAFPVPLNQKASPNMLVCGKPVANPHKSFGFEKSYCDKHVAVIRKTQ